MYSLFDEKIFKHDKVINDLLSGAFLKSLSIQKTAMDDVLQ